MGMELKIIMGFTGNFQVLATTERNRDVGHYAWLLRVSY